MLRRQLFACGTAFAALLADGAVVAWGDARFGGSSAAVQWLRGVRSIAACDGAFAALCEDGALSEAFSGRWARARWETPAFRFRKRILAFVACCENLNGIQDGRVVTWGNRVRGGDSFNVQDQLYGVLHISATAGAFAALRDDGSVVTWGSRAAGNDASCAELTGVKEIRGTHNAFAAILGDGSVFACGEKMRGGDCSQVQDQLRGVHELYSNAGAFAAILETGRVVTWGDQAHGGDSSAVQSQLLDVQTIASSAGAFAAVRSDSSIITWGHSDFGGDSTSVQTQLQGASWRNGQLQAFVRLQLSDVRIIAYKAPCFACNIWIVKMMWDSSCVKRFSSCFQVGPGYYVLWTHSVASRVSLPRTQCSRGTFVFSFSPGLGNSSEAA